jgi:hypothetical protein
MKPGFRGSFVQQLSSCTRFSANLVAATTVQTSLGMMGEAEQCHGA